jgi:hypothetical protein
VVSPTLTAVSEVLALSHQSLVQLAGEQRDAVRAGVVAKPVTGHADLAAAAGAQHGLIEIGPGLDGRLNGPGILRNGPAQTKTYAPGPVRTHVLARVAVFHGWRVSIRRSQCRKGIRHGSFSSVKELIAKIEQFVAAYNKTKAPFNWTATADSILEKLQRLCSQISETAH